MSGYTIGEIVVWLLLTSILGFVLGWMARELIYRRQHGAAAPDAEVEIVPAARKAPAKKTPAKKTPATKAPAKKTLAKKAPAKKAAAKRTPAKKAAAKRPPAKKAPVAPPDL